MNKRINAYIFAIAIAAAFAACSGNRQQNTERSNITSTQESEIDTAQGFSPPPIIDLFQYNTDYNYSFMEDFRIWGWSRDGRVAYSVTGRDGGITSLYFNIVDYFSPDSHSVSYWENFDDFNVDEDGYYLDVDGNRIDFNEIYRDFHTVCNENGIEFIQSDFRRPPIIHNNRTFNVNLVLSKQEMDDIDIVESYRLIAETQGTRSDSFQPDRFVYTAEDGYAYDVFLLGYFLSPFENRALLSMGKIIFGGYITDFFVGLDLDNGFTATTETAHHSEEDTYVISVSHAPDNIAGDYHTFTDEYPYERIIISTAERVENFAYVEIYPFVDPNDELFLIIGDTLFGLDDFTPDKPLVVTTSIGSGIPSRGICFIYHGSARYFFITESGMDGSLQLSEFTPLGDTMQ